MGHIYQVIKNFKMITVGQNFDMRILVTIYTGHKPMKLTLDFVHITLP